MMDKDVRVILDVIAAIHPDGLKSYGAEWFARKIEEGLRDKGYKLVYAPRMEVLDNWENEGGRSG